MDDWTAFEFALFIVILTLCLSVLQFVFFAGVVHVIRSRAIVKHMDHEHEKEARQISLRSDDATP